MQYSSEDIETGVSEIDVIVASQSLDIQDYQILMENNDKFIYEYEANSYAILESFNTETIDPLAQNDDFELEIDILDFTDRNPFGEVN